MASVIVDNALYSKGVRVPLECDVADLAAVRGRCGPGDFVWIGLFEPDEAELAEVADVFDLHALAVEDAVTAHQRPKLERYDESLFLVLKTLWYVDEDDAVETGEINMFVGTDFVVTVRHGQGGGLHEARLALEEREKVLAHGPSAVVYAVCDQVVDIYDQVADALTVDVDEVENSVFSDERTNDSARIYVLKRELAEVRRAVMPLREPIGRFTAGVGGRRPPGRRAVLPRRGRPPGPDRGDRGQPRLAAVGRVRGPAGPDQHPAERRHEEDLGRGRAVRRARRWSGRSTA